MKTHFFQQKSVYFSMQFGLRKTRIISLILSLAVLNLSMSCSYYSVRNVPTTKDTISKEIKTFNEAEKYVILHSNTSTWHLKNMVINEDDQTMSGTIIPLGFEHQYKKPRESKRVHGYDKSKTMPLNEVHFYLKDSIDGSANSEVQIPLSNINSISVNDKNTNRTIANIALTTVGIAFVVF